MPVYVPGSVSQEVTIWSTAQSAFTLRELVAKGLELPLYKVRVIAPPIVGGFGGKAGITVEPLCLAAALDPDIKGRPVKLFVPREEVLTTSWVRQGWNTKVKMGVKKDGTISAMKVELVFDTGTSAEYGANPVRSAGYTSMGCYYVPNIWTDSYGVYTNKPFGGAYRGFGLPELMGGLEAVVDAIAYRIGMDPIEFRLKNLLKPGLPTCTGMPMPPHALDKIIKKVAEKIDYHREEPPIRKGWKRGKGIALAIKAPAMPADASSSATVEIWETARSRSWPQPWTGTGCIHSLCPDCFGRARSAHGAREVLLSGHGRSALRLADRGEPLALVDGHGHKARLRRREEPALSPICRVLAVQPRRDYDRGRHREMPQVGQGRAHR